MTKEKPPLNKAEWVLVAKKVKKIEATLWEIMHITNSRMPKSTKSMKQLVKSHNEISKLKSLLEDDMFRQHPDWEDTEVFYGPRNKPED